MSKESRVTKARVFLGLARGTKVKRAWVDAIVDRRDNPASWPDDLKDFVLSLERQSRGELVRVAAFLRTLPQGQ